MIDRKDTAWRQGSLLKPEELHHLEVDAAQGFAAIVISHDCDIPNPVEAVIELIVCKRVAKEDKLLCNARNVRKLHLPFHVDSVDAFFELTFQKRVELTRDEFAAKFSGPDESFSLSDHSKRVLKQWLAVRYGRPAYPNAFEERLRSVKVGKDILERKLAKLIEPQQTHLVGIWVDLDTDKNIELPPEDAYYLKMVLVYRTDGQLEASRLAAEALGVAIQEAFQTAFTEERDQIVLDTCEAVADNRFSLADIMKFDQWRVEYISMSANDDSFVPTGA